MSLGTSGNDGVPCFRPVRSMGRKAVGTTSSQLVLPSLGSVLESVAGRIPSPDERALLAAVWATVLVELVVVAVGFAVASASTPTVAPAVAAVVSALQLTAATVEP